MTTEEQIKYWKGIRYETRRSLWGQRPGPFAKILRERLDFANAEMERLSKIQAPIMTYEARGVSGTIPSA